MMILMGWVVSGRKYLGWLACFLLTFVLSYRLPAQSESQDFSLEHIDISSGLSNNYVSKIAEGQFGQMWFASEGGLNSFNGTNLQLFRPNSRYSGLLNENIETVLVDRSNNIWVGTKSGGVSVYSQVLDRFENLNDRLPKELAKTAIRVTDIVEDKDGNIWIATWGQGLHVLSGVEYELTKSFLPGLVIRNLEADPYGNVWAAGTGELLKYDPSEDRMIRIDLPVGVVMGFCYDQSKDRLLLGSSKGLFSVDAGNYSLTQIPSNCGVEFSRINAIDIDSSGRIWVGSWFQGLYYSNPEQTKFEKFSLSPQDPTNTNYEIIVDILVDRNDFIWVGTGYGGVVKINPNKSVVRLANTLGNHIGLPDNNIQAVIQDTRGALWCGSWGDGIGYSTDGKTFSRLPNVDQLKVSAFLETDGVMIVGTSKGVRLYHVDSPERGAFASSLERVKVKHLYLDRKNRLWLSTQQTGLMLINYQNDPLLRNPQIFNADVLQPGVLLSDRVSQVVEDSAGKIWIGTYNGLYLFEESDSTFVRMDQEPNSTFPSVIFLSILTSNFGDMWLGMPGGLIRSRYQDGKVKILETFNVQEGLKNDYVTAVTQDIQGNVWISTASGLATIRDETHSVINLMQEDQSYSMNINSCFNTGQNIFFGSSNGLFRFDPMQVQLLNEPPGIVFDNLKIDNKSVLVGDEINGRVVLEKALAFTEKIEITHLESIVSLSFLPDDFKNQISHSYQYRILGLQDDWIDNGNATEISLIGLNSGTYELKVRSTLDSATFGEEATLVIKVIPPPWLSAWAKAIYGVLAILLIYLVSQFFVGRAKLKANLALSKLTQQKEHELNEAKLRFFTNISHELRTPLTLIISPVEELMREKKLPEGLKERLTYIERNAQRLLELINQLIDFRKADQGELRLKVGTGNYVKFAKEVFLSFKGYAETKGVTYKFKTTLEDIELTFDRDKMEIVLCNLLSNAFKFTSDKGRILMTISEDESHCLVSVKDTGKGISREYQDKIFNRFFQIQDAESAKVVGSGIGLSLSKKIALLHHGDLFVSSVKGKGTEFVLKIPKGVDHFESEDIIQGFANSESIGHYILPDKIESNTTVEAEAETKKILIVEDNRDVASYLGTIFTEEGYQVLMAENGQIGCEQALEEIPDLILSDVMMPEMDGIELCKKLKSDIQTSHIPIILLTARTSTVYEIDGLKIGADDYVRKPFDATVIKSKVSTTLENRQRVRAHLLNKVRFESSTKIKPINKEEKFIQDISVRVEDNLHDQAFGIEVLADELCMSQSTLYRKIKSLTGMSIAGFIRSIRLKKASEILLTEDLNLSQVAYKVGFNDYKYFKKSFKEQYGCLPSEYVAKHQQTVSSEP